MNKIGSKPIEKPQSVLIEVNNQMIEIKGKEGVMSLCLPENLKIEMRDDKIYLKTNNNDKSTISQQGLFRQLINNAIIGVEKKWEKRLEIVGTGYGVQLKGQDLVLKLGYSHPVIFPVVSGITFKTEGNNIIVVQGCDKQLVGEVAERIKKTKKPDSYKGKGIRYQGERINLKPTKKVKAGTTV